MFHGTVTEEWLCTVLGCLRVTGQSTGEIFHKNAVFVQQIKVQSHHDLVDEEVGMLSDAVVKLKGMVKQIGEEGEETGV